MIEKMTGYFRECLDDLKDDIKNNIGNGLYDGDNDAHVRRYAKYISLLNFIKKNNGDTICLPMINKLIGEFNEQLDIKNDRIESGMYSDNELLLEYIQTNINRYETFIGGLNSVKNNMSNE